MNFKAITLAALMAAGTTYAYAEPGGEHSNTNCQGNGNANSPCEGSGGNGGNGGTSDQVQTQSQGQAQGQSQESTNVNGNQNEINSTTTSDSNATAVSGSNSNSNSFSGGNSLGSSVDISTGPTSSSSTATGGTADAMGGDSTSDASGGSVVFSNIETKSAASAAAVYSQVCQLGGSAQGIAGGFSISNADVLCDHLKVASAMQAAYEYELRTCHCVGICTTEEASVAQECTGDDAMADVYLEAYHDNMGAAVSIMEGTHHVGLMDKIAGALVRPLAVLGVLIWLI